MLIRLHNNATTTRPAPAPDPEYIRTSPKGIKTLARKLNLNPGTLRKWRGRESPLLQKSAPIGLVQQPVQ